MYQLSSHAAEWTIMSPQSLDSLVLGTVNAPWKRMLDAELLADKVAHVDTNGWLPHLATFFNEVSPHLVLGFAEAHHIPETALVETYAKVKKLTGESNRKLEGEFAGLAKAA